MDFDDHGWMLKQLRKAQEAETDSRNWAREAELFIAKRDGQWEPHLVQQNSKKPRYTFDQVSPIIEQIAGPMERADFDIKVSPLGGNASKETAETYDGLVRNIETVSNAVQIYNAAGRKGVVSGIGGWRVVHDYVTSDSFDQDLKIERISNFVDRVWFGPFEEPDASDAPYAWVLSGMNPEDFKAKHPDRAEMSVDNSRSDHAYFYKSDVVVTGEFLYKKEIPVELILMSDGQVFEEGEKYRAVVDELAALGITEIKRRIAHRKCVYSRKFDLNGWLKDGKDDKPKKTVFKDWLPIVPVLANFDVIDGKVIYYGAVEKLMDPQRVFNYTKSREVEEGALAPREKIVATQKQAAGHEAQWAKLNTSSDPVMFYNPDPEANGPPSKMPGAQINAGLATLSESMRGILSDSAGMHAATMGDNPALQSGVAIDKLQDRGDIGNNKYSTAREIAQRHTGRILVSAIPEIYPPRRQVRILDEDGTTSMVTIGEEVIDNETGQIVVMNDLSQGQYDVACHSGPSFKNRQSETVRALVEIGKVDPEVIAMSGDVLLQNIQAPGMSALARRKRAQLFKAGIIPMEDMTEEEKAQVQAAQAQPPQEDPMMVAARAEEAKAQADLVDAQTKQAKVQGDIQIKLKELTIKQADLKVRAFQAETDRYKAEISAAEAKANIQGKGAKAAKDLAEAEAQDIENDSVITGLSKMMEGING